MTEPTLVYLAEPIDQLPAGTSKADARDYLTHGTGLRESLRMAGFGMFKPRSGFHVPQLDPRVEAINRHALYQADCIVAHLPAGIPSIGVPAEIEAATARGIPAVVLTAVESQALAGNRLVTVIDTPASAAEAVRHAIRTHPRAAVDSALRLVVRDGFTPPTRAFPDDAGIDLNTAIGVTLEPGEYVDVMTQVTGSELPDGYWGLITGRSSTLRKLGILVPNGIIDPGWRGALFVGALNLSKQPVTIGVGERIGQLILVPNHPAAVQVVSAVSDHARGLNGFGSSGA